MKLCGDEILESCPWSLRERRFPSPTFDSPPHDLRFLSDSPGKGSIQGLCTGQARRHCFATAPVFPVTALNSASTTVPLATTA
ncbi:unnamed protein product [Linum trigynum]|uniref:Uncharacterized protein n=1 Tax=Linum trigynum TaxID=586398 RepID=A0AAV2EVY7_9ROSI